ncbi:MAG: putative O-glycosylation ligase, exosortase A system-associated [Acidobacteriaceae bacterium]|nr:putative O-glycosylation ligase, exosortase A system-associated [Acidobacteriaceae bacterium]
MRDYIVFAVTGIGLLYTLRRPWIGVLLYAWFAYMSPHRLCYWRAYNFPFTLAVVLVLLVSLLFSRERKWPPLTRNSVLLLLFAVWMTVTSFTALNPEAAWVQWREVMKILFMVLVILTLMQTKERLHSFVWVVVASLGYYGVRGTVGALTGGGSRVQGPDGTFIADNNDLALALVTVIPLVVYALGLTRNKLLRLTLIGLIGCLGIAVMGTYSRAGMLALIAIAVMLCWKSKHRVRTGLLATGLLALVYFIAPPDWFARMNTIGSYQQDASAMGRINAWHFAVNLTHERPITGGGFEAFTPELFEKYAPDPDNFHAAHSIYFKILGEHGYVGLFLFFSLWVSAWWTGDRVRKAARRIEGCEWAEQLAGIAQVALVGYAVGGAFNNLSYFDLPYHLMAIIAGCKIAVDHHRAAEDPIQDAFEDADQQELTDAVEACA